MKKNIFFIILFLLTTSCQSQNNHTFLGSFNEINNLEVNIVQNFRKEVGKEILNQEVELYLPLIKNEMFYSERGISLRYYYSGKYKISDDYWLIGIKVIENLDYKYLFGLYDNKLNKVTSIIKVEEYSIGNTTKTEYINGIFYIRSIYKNVPNGLDPKPGNEFTTLTVENNFKIINGNLVNIKN